MCRLNSCGGTSSTELTSSSAAAILDNVGGIDPLTPGNDGPTALGCDALDIPSAIPAQLFPSDGNMVIPAQVIPDAEAPVIPDVAAAMVPYDDDPTSGWHLVALVGVLIALSPPRGHKWVSVCVSIIHKCGRPDEFTPDTPLVGALLSESSTLDIGQVLVVT